MAGRAAQRPSVVASLSLPTVDDPTTQRALEQTQDATQDLQVLVRRLRADHDELSTDVASLTGRYLARRVIAASGSYTPTAGTVRAIVRMCGAGGGGGGAAAVANSSAGGGGASGVTIEFTLGPDATDIGQLAAGTVAIGAAGTAGTTAPGAGGTGGDTTLTIGSTTYTAKGGGGGAAGSQSGVGTATGGSPGTGSTAGVPQTAEYGLSGLLVDASGNGLQGVGGASPFGRTMRGTVVGTPPLQAVGYGAGGSGGVVTGVASCAGAAGAPGVVIVEEFS